MGDPRYFDKLTRADVRVFVLVAFAIGAFLLDAWVNHRLFPL